VSLAPFLLSEKPQDSTGAAAGFTENAKNISRLGWTAEKACGFGAAIREPDVGRIVLHSLSFCDVLTQRNRDSTVSIELPRAAQLDATPDFERRRIAATVTILQHAPEAIDGWRWHERGQG
jgi:hypothetical protein